MKIIESRFYEYFARWEISLSSGDVALRQRGKIVKGGWEIWYLFGLNEKGEYLDFYASHRMTSDSHVRIYGDGSEQRLPTIKQFRVCSDDEHEDRLRKAEYYAENQRIARMLEDKGFGPSGEKSVAAWKGCELHPNRRA